MNEVLNDQTIRLCIIDAFRESEFDAVHNLESLVEHIGRVEIPDNFVDMDVVED